MVGRIAAAALLAWSATAWAVDERAPGPVRCQQYRSEQPGADAESHWKFGAGEYWSCHDCNQDPGCLARVVERLKYAAERKHLRAAEDLSVVYGRAAMLPDAARHKLHWARQAAMAGGGAQAYQYAIYLLPPNQPADVGQAVEWLQIAADKGERRAMLELATMFFSGSHVPQSYSRANLWYRRLAEAGSTAGMLLLGMNLQAGYGGADAVEAVSWYRKAYEAGERGRAPYLLGLAYERGIGVKRNEREAARWYERVRGTVDVCTAQFRLGLLYERGEGVARDMPRALKHYEKARNSDPYQCWSLYEHLAALHEEGRIAKQDLQQAEAYRTKAQRTKAGYAPAKSGRPDPYADVLALEPR
jgi:TPR repeat protein